MSEVGVLFAMHRYHPLLFSCVCVEKMTAAEEQKNLTYLRQGRRVIAPITYYLVLTPHRTSYRRSDLIMLFLFCLLAEE